MPVVVDSQTIDTEPLGLSTVGDVIQHLQRDDRLVVHILVDGAEPDLDRIGQLRASPINGHTLFIETADPRQMARQLLAELSEQVERTRDDQRSSADLLQQGLAGKALERLAGCFRIWSNAEDAVSKVARLLRLDLAQVKVGDQSLMQSLQTIGEDLRQIRQALQDRDFVLLSDVLLYESSQTADRWAALLRALDSTITSLR